MSDRRDQRSAEAQAWRSWYSSSRWRRLRQRQLAAEPLCRYCHRDGRITEATICDHEIPHKGDVLRFWQGPFQSLCETCHNSLKQREERGRAPVRIGLDGWPVQD